MAQQFRLAKNTIIYPDLWIMVRIHLLTEMHIKDRESKYRNFHEHPFAEVFFNLMGNPLLGESVGEYIFEFMKRYIAYPVWDSKQIQVNCPKHIEHVTVYSLLLP